MSAPRADTREDIQRRIDEARATRDREVLDRATSAARDALKGVVGGQAAAAIAVKAAAPILRDLGRWEVDNAITWDTTCLNCSTLMDSVYAETMRAEKAEAALADAVALAEELLGGHCRVCSHNMRLERARAALGQGAD